MNQTRILSIYTDGGARGNPRPAAIRVYITSEQGKLIAEIGKKIGDQTNNVAEYRAILEALDWVGKNIQKFSNLLRINFFMDSNLAASQLNGIYKVKNPNLRILLFEIRQKEAELNLPISYVHIPREKNIKADKLVNMALDKVI